MQVKLIEGTDDPEKLVCRAARNDYLPDGVIEEVTRGGEPTVIERDFEEIMKAIDPEFHHVAEVGEYYDKIPAQYLEDDGEWTDVNLDNIEDYIVTEAKKRTLLDHLIDSGHWGPFEHPQTTIALNGVTRVLMAQITRHRHFTFDIMSLRYVGLDDNFTLKEHGTVQSETDNQVNDQIKERFEIPKFRGEDFDVDRHGMHEFEEDIDKIENTYLKAYKDSIRHYLRLLDLGVPQERARKVLPMGTKVNIVISANARAWMHILNVRTKANVQGETRRAAEAILNEMQNWMPYTIKKYKEDVLPLKLNP